MWAQSNYNKKNKLQNDTASRMGTKNGYKLIFY